MEKLRSRFSTWRSSFLIGGGIESFSSSCSEMLLFFSRNSLTGGLKLENLQQMQMKVLFWLKPEFSSLTLALA